MSTSSPLSRHNVGLPLVTTRKSRLAVLCMPPLAKGAMTDSLKPISTRCPSILEDDRPEIHATILDEAFQSGSRAQILTALDRRIFLHPDVVEPPCLVAGRRKLLLEMVAGTDWGENGEACCIGGGDVALDCGQRVKPIRLPPRLLRDTLGCR